MIQNFMKDIFRRKERNNCNLENKTLYEFRNHAAI